MNRDEVLQRRIKSLTKRRNDLSARMQQTDNELNVARLELSKLNHPCACVVFNSDIGVYSAETQDKVGRVGLEAGLVANTLSARRECTICNGTGKPNL